MVHTKKKKFFNLNWKRGMCCFNLCPVSFLFIVLIFPINRDFTSCVLTRILPALVPQLACCWESVIPNREIPLINLGSTKNFSVSAQMRKGKGGMMTKRKHVVGEGWIGPPHGENGQNWKQTRRTETQENICGHNGNLQFSKAPGTGLKAGRRSLEIPTGII